MILPNHKPSSRNSERSHCNRMIQHFGNCNMREIGTEQVQLFVSGLNGSGENLKPKTIHNIVKTMSILWATAKRWGYVEGNPIEDLSLPRLDAMQAPCYTLEQVKGIIAAAAEPYKTLFWIVAETGIRGGEVCGLSVDDISFGTGTILVQRSAWRGHLQSPKTDNAIRCFPISKELLDHIREYLESMWRANPSRLLFCSVNGNALDNAEVVKKVLHPLTDRLQLPRGGLHALRHMNATELDRLNVPVAVRRERLGHAQFTTTLRYTHAMSADHRRVADQLGKLLGQEVLP